HNNTVGIQLGGSSGSASRNTFVNNTIVDNEKGIFIQTSQSNQNIFSFNLFNNIKNAEYAVVTLNFFNLTLGNYWSDWSSNSGYDTLYFVEEHQSQIDYHPLQCMQDSHCQQQTFCDGNNVVQGSGTCQNYQCVYEQT